MVFEDLKSEINSGAVVIPGDATNSLLAELVSIRKCQTLIKLTYPQIQSITDWIKQGALNN